MLDAQQQRRVVPRWRQSWVSARTAEAWTQPPRAKQNFSDELIGKQLEFERAKTIPVAAELMFLATEAGNSDIARTAASLILERVDRIGATSLVQAARKVFEGSNEDRFIARGNDFIREARKLLSIDFRNPILLMDIARELTAKGQETAALRYVRTAVGLAPQSRFVIRSATRYYLHTGEHELAHDLLRKSVLLRSDPWIQASEIAVATVRGRTSSIAKQTISALTSEKLISANKSELASAVATVELLSGSEKKAKKLFQQALFQPNDNSLAQAEWAATRLRLVVNEVALRTPFSFEANSNNAYRRLQLGDAIEHAKYWSEDEPFASRPLDTLCHLFCLEGKYSEAREAAEKAIKVDGGHSFSSNLNLLFTKIQSGDVDVAYTDLIRLGKHPEAKGHAIQLLANAGALAYATGDLKLGSEFYQRAIQAARSRGEPHMEALARAFYARAAEVAGDENSLAIVADAAKNVERLPSPGAIHIVRTLVDVGKRNQLDATVSARVAKRRWAWDAATNTLRAIE